MFSSRSLDAFPVYSPTWAALHYDWPICVRLGFFVIFLGRIVIELAKRLNFIFSSYILGPSVIQSYTRRSTVIQQSRDLS